MWRTSLIIIFLMVWQGWVGSLFDPLVGAPSLQPWGAGRQHSWGIRGARAALAWGGCHGVLLCGVEFLRKFSFCGKAECFLKYTIMSQSMFLQGWPGKVGGKWFCSISFSPFSGCLFLYTLAYLKEKQNKTPPPPKKKTQTDSVTICNVSWSSLTLCFCSAFYFTVFPLSFKASVLHKFVINLGLIAVASTCLLFSLCLAWWVFWSVVQINLPALMHFLPCFWCSSENKQNNPSDHNLLRNYLCPYKWPCLPVAS